MHRGWLSERYLIVILGVAGLAVALRSGLCPIPASAAPPSKDRAITLAIEDKLLTDPGVPAHLIDVESGEGIVTLSGSVDTGLAKERATKAAGTLDVPGLLRAESLAEKTRLLGKAGIC